MTAIDALFEEAAALTEKALDRLLPKPLDTEAPIFEAMRYSVLSGGKRLRPLLVLASSRLFGVADSCSVRVAAAVECIHCHRLVHDDLPALDDDDQRRGKPSTHRQFGEAAAILAGDALLALAFEIVADENTHADPLVRSRLVSALAKAAGGRGMIGGQMIDMIGEEQELDLGAVTRSQRMKTGELFAFACESGAILGRVDTARRHALHAFAHDLGLVFQITGHLLDAEGRRIPDTRNDDATVTPGKATFVTILGVERAREQARLLTDQAIRHLDIFEGRADDLRAIARFVLDRTA